jgi:hypothetical protein
VTVPAHRGARGVATSARPGSRDGHAPTLGIATRLALSAATAFLAVNLWTGAPLFALWVGSRAVGQKQLTFQAVAIVVVVLGVLVFAIAFALAKLNASYDRLIGRPTRERRLTWLRSYRDEDWRKEVHQLEGITLLEGIIMVNVCIAEIAFLVWFFAFAGSPFPR